MKTPAELVETFKRLLLGEEEGPAVELAEGVEAEVECGRSGTVTDRHGQTVEFNPKNLAELAGRLNPEAIVKIGHTKIQTDTPHYGDVVGLRYDSGKDRLFAKINPTPALVRKNREEGFRRVSMELSAESKKGPFDFNAVAFLAACPPAVKGLTPVQLAATADPKVFCFAGPASDVFGEVLLESQEAPTTEGKKPVAKKTLDTDETVNLEAKDEEERTHMDHAAELAAANAETAKQKAENDRLREQLKTGARATVKAFLAENVKRIPMALRKAGLEEGLVALLASEIPTPSVLEFSIAQGEGQEPKAVKQSASAFLFSLLGALPEQVRGADGVELTRDQGTDGAPKTGPILNDFAITATDPEGDELFEATQAEIASAKAAGKVISFDQAAEAVVAKRGGSYRQ